MSTTRRKTAWMWLAGDHLQGVFIDVEEQVLTWIWQAGCHCACDEEIVQSVASFCREGAPPLIGALPIDVAAEIDAVLEANESDPLSAKRTVYE